ncbi:MAG: gamma-glutamyl-gamma-aminobutyrate hydrolase family protein, partial [Deltaproteobacteria bacterium]|nr:gamma-glutamyl-gamma-aminobutyrate hydrolase family protein [Deltaproteobacteria bacterium]
MRKALVIQHVPHEGLGAIGPALAECGIEPDILKVYKGMAVPGSIGPGVSALIVMGGPMGVYEDDVFPFIKDELKLIESALKENLPILGVCLGSQLLAKAGGADVYRGKAKEIGWYKLSLTDEGKRDKLLLGLPPEMMVFQWHGDTFDVPGNGANLASSELFPNQMFRVGRRAYGVQFHFEVTPGMIKDWIDVNGGELNALKGKIDADRIFKDTPRYMADLNRLGRTVISR